MSARDAVKAIVIALLAWLPGYAQAQAQCRISAQPTNLAFNQVNFSRDTPVGAPISEVITMTVTMHCPGSNQGLEIMINPVYLRATTVDSTWQTPMQGIGVRAIKTTWPSRYISDIDRRTYLPPARVIAHPIYNRNANTTTYTITHQLIKTGPIADPSRFNIGTLYSYLSRNVTTQTMSAPQVNVTLARITATSRSCRVSTGNVTVPMPPVAASLLNTVGATAGVRDFFIGLRCDTGVNVYVTMTDATTPANRTDLLTLTRASTARGVAIRVRNPSNAPVRFGPDAATAGTENQWLVGPSTATMNIPMTAEYVATGAVAPGTVSALATFTMSYQ